MSPVWRLPIMKEIICTNPACYEIFPEDHSSSVKLLNQYVRHWLTLNVFITIFVKWGEWPNVTDTTYQGNKAIARHSMKDTRSLWVDVDRYDTKLMSLQGVSQLQLLAWCPATLKTHLSSIRYLLILSQMSVTLVEGALTSKCTETYNLPTAAMHVGWKWVLYTV